MELNCRVRNSQESIKNVLKRQILSLKKYDPEIATWSSLGHPNKDKIPISGMREFPNGDYLSFDDVMRLFE